MPRRDSAGPLDPYHVWGTVVDDQQRIRLPLSAADVVPWLNSPSGTVIERLAVPGRVGLQLVDLATYDEERRAFDAAISVDSAQSPNSSDSWVEAARLLASVWRVRISIQATQIRFGLPEEPRLAGLLPSAGERAVVFGFRTLLEVCAAKAWSDHVAALNTRRTELVAGAIDYLAPE